MPPTDTRSSRRPRYLRPALAVVVAAWTATVVITAAPATVAARPVIEDATRYVVTPTDHPDLSGEQAATGDAQPGVALDGFDDLAARRAAAVTLPIARPIPPALDTLTGYRWPLWPARLTQPFGPSPWGSRVVDGQPFHDGIDLATSCGDRITAAHAGTVLAAGRDFDRFIGWVGDLEPYFDRLDRGRLWPTLPIVVVIDDGNGYRSMYAHFSRTVVEPGQVVRAGQLLGFEGDTGRASGCHLHYGLFSPWETATFAIRGDIARRMKLPRDEIARVDPLEVLPPKRGIK